MRPRRTAAIPPILECTFVAAPVEDAFVEPPEVVNVDSEVVVVLAALDASVEAVLVAVWLESIADCEDTLEYLLDRIDTLAHKGTYSAAALHQDVCCCTAATLAGSPGQLL